MKRLILLLSLLAGMTCHLRANEYQYMVFTLTDGTTQFLLANDLSISFDDGNLIAQSKSGVITIPLKNLQKMAFSNDATEGIGQIENNSEDEEPVFFDLQGRQVTREQMHKGVFIVKTKTKTYKMTVK